MMLRAEGNRWGVVLLAPVGDPLPVEEQAFRDFLRGLGDGELRDVLVDAEPLSPIHRFGSTANRVRHYERLERWPSGLVALGDSVCALDPYYGLGMTVTARGVALLESRLDGLARGHGGEPERGYQEELAALNEQPWSLATGRDTDGRPLSRASEHLRRLYRSAPKDPAVARALVEVQHLLRPLDTLTQSSPA